MVTKVLIVDDSALMRALLTEIIGGASDLKVVGSAPDPIAAREMIKSLNPDVLTLDVEMPKMDGLTLCNRILGFVNAPSLMQRVIAGLKGVKVDVDLYRKKRDLLCDGLASVGYRVRKPDGAFYLFLPTPIADDVRFADALQKRRILTVPGSGFYGPGHIRIAYCVDDATILGAIEGFGEVWKAFQ